MKVFKKKVLWTGMFHDMSLYFVQIDGLSADQICELVLTLDSMESDELSVPAFRMAAESVRMLVQEHALPMFLPARIGKDGERIQNLLSAVLKPEQRQVFLRACAMSLSAIQDHFSEDRQVVELDPLAIGAKVRINVDAVNSRMDMVDPESVLFWWLNYGDPNDVFVIRKKYDSAFPEYPFILDRFLCEASFSAEELIPVV